MSGPVGLVLVSHSALLAAGLRELLSQLAAGVPVVAAAGDEDGGLGTSSARTAGAIAAADRGAGVVLLADLGSAVLTTKAVLAGLPAGSVAGAVLADAPFVEGAVAAAVAAAAGAPLAEVVAAAAQAREFRKR
ncbi:PTS-dependent dihydroxyacetone kinase phosphotransferase subunit DhaM [Streptomyces sp. TLI_171]|uniref:PTS-dependent dihydroxyacetone kinase phosphotransferase subunit DhaM n=1 Tax=Streptomyces sp. TLI_171 TaxID=1938859 RepID=UPI000C1A157E|nr:phosphoenolpyruvate--protein phosphotransferase [Streptomyces sp. TLI_171]RKE23121.1 dihydroxyacetone kinase DhaKLM complex PTS-EIIA-like component DhaM [Streptomyces sp. TLI_171]